VGIKGITQLVQGPQFATGVGLVKFGAQALAHAREAGIAAARVTTARRTTTEIEAQIHAEPKKAKFLQWLKAAF
jgi:cell division protein FtsA